MLTIRKKKQMSLTKPIKHFLSAPIQILGYLFLCSDIQVMVIINVIWKYATFMQCVTSLQCAVQQQLNKDVLLMRTNLQM